MKNLPLAGSCTLLLACLGLTGCLSGNPDGAAAGSSKQAASSANGYHASVVRTGYGVPHITADDWDSLGYGYGYTIAEDNLCTLADAFVTVRGERSRWYGADGALTTPSTLTLTAKQATNLELDVYFRSAADAEYLARYRAAQSPEFNKLVDGYAAGFSRYAEEIRAGQHPGRHADCRDGGWVGAITSDDLYRRFHALMLALTETRLINEIANAAPPSAADAKTASVSAFDPSQLIPKVDPTPLGSNAMAFGSDATGTGHGLLFGNPHWMWIGMDRFYQVHLRIPGKVDIQGVSIMGMPLVLIGFNQDVAWSHTVSTGQRMSFYQLNLVDGDPTSYVFDGKVRKLETSEVTVPTLQADGSLVDVKRTLYRSHYGPMLARDWNGKHAISVRAANLDNLRTFSTWMDWSQAKSLDAFIDIHRRGVALPWVNTLAAGRNDPRGWYGDLSVIPYVSDAQQKECGVAPLTLDGSRSQCDWIVDPDSAQPGALPAKLLPQVTTRRFVANMNDSYWLADPDKPSTSSPKVVGDTNAVQSFRTRMGLVLARERLDGSDGRPGKLATSETVRDMVMDGRNMTSELFRPAVLKDTCAKPQVTLADGSKVDIGPACQVLAKWDGRGNADSVGAHIWETFWTQLTRAVPSDKRYLTPFNAADPVGTPRDLDTTQPGVAQALAQTVVLLDKRGIALDAPLRSYQYWTDGDGSKLALPGGCGESGYFAIACTRISADKTEVVPHGNSYMQVVGFDASGPQAWTLLMSSQATDPASPYYRGGTRLYAQKTWQRAAYTDAEINAQAISRVQLDGAVKK